MDRIIIILILVTPVIVTTTLKVVAHFRLPCSLTPPLVFAGFVSYVVLVPCLICLYFLQCLVSTSFTMPALKAFYVLLPYAPSATVRGKLPVLTIDTSLNAFTRSLTLVLLAPPTPSNSSFHNDILPFAAAGHVPPSLASFQSRLRACRVQSFEAGGEGDCFFKSFAHQFFGCPQKHLEVRQWCAKHILDHCDEWADFEFGDVHRARKFSSFISSPGVPAETIAVTAVAQHYQTIIYLIESNSRLSNIITTIYPHHPLRPHGTHYPAVLLGILMNNITYLRYR